MRRAESVTFKGSKRGITLVLSAEADFGAALEELRKKLAKAGDFFGGAAVTVHVEHPLAPDEAVALVGTLCGDYGLRLAGIQDTSMQVSPAPPVGRRTVSPPPPPITAAAVHQPGGEQTMLVRRTVRSGQRIAYDGNVVVMGDVNPGGEVVATGDIIVWGTLRGTAHAGAQGDTGASVTALRLVPTQLRIAHLITRAPDGKPAKPKTPETAHIKGEAVEVEEFAL